MRRRKPSARRAVSGILSALILFVMLFTVGTGYFLFVNAENLQYTKVLTTRTNAVQAQLSETLTLATAQGSNGHLTFTAYDAGPQAVTIVAMFVTSPTGSVQYSTSSPSPVSMNPGVTSQSIDTAYQ